MEDGTTWSPTWKSVTPSPTSATTPAPSCPSTSGGGKRMVPLAADRSLWQTPQAASVMVISPCLGGSTRISSTCRGAFHSRQTTAFAILDMLFSSGRVRAQYRRNIPAAGRPREVIKMDDTERRQLATAIRDECVRELLDAYEQAGMSGLCAEGRWEVAVGRVRSLSDADLLERAAAITQERA